MHFGVGVLLAHFWPMFPFHTSIFYTSILYLLALSRRIKWEHWPWNVFYYISFSNEPEPFSLKYFLWFAKICEKFFFSKIHSNTTLAAICLHNQLSSFNSILVQMSEKRDSPNRQWKWISLLLSVTFTAKLELVFVLTFENAFS